MSIETLSQDLSAYLDSSLIEQVEKSYYFARDAHEGQTRTSGEPYITHPLAVAKILATMHMDHQSLMAAMLHDVIEDTGVDKNKLGNEFGETVADLVDGVSKFKQIKFESRAEAQAENFQKMALAMAKDIRVILVKLADRLHNMRTLGVLAPNKRRRIARETLEIYAPIAHRLGMNNIRIELEDLGFSALHPMRSERIARAVKNIRGHRKEIVEDIRESIETRLHKQGIEAHIVGREKHLWSIYQKMRVKGRSFSDIMDVYAFRITVDCVDTCYRSLGIVHDLYKPMPGRFKDYIAIPKSNGYQSIHTSLFGMHGIPIEIQIRTNEMEAIASNGVASHWLYKSDDDNTYSSGDARTRDWLKGLLELQQSAGDSLEFIENVKIDLFPDEVYVFTPRGNIMKLPAGSTAVDFAYAVHSDVGHSCIACRIDRHLAPLSRALQSGETVEIITAASAKPNLAWLNFVISGKARSHIRHYLKNQQRDESVALGRRLLTRSLSELDGDIEQMSDDIINKVLTETKHECLDDLLEDIGLGTRMSQVVARRFIPVDDDINDEHGAALTIRGTEGMVINYAKCCRPIPGDSVIGHISAGRGMVVHLESCRNIADQRENIEKFIHVRWEKDVIGEYPVDLRVEMENTRGILAVVAATISDSGANIEKISTEDKDARLTSLSLTITVKDRVHLARIMKRVRIIKGISKIIRARS